MSFTSIDLLTIARGCIIAEDVGIVHPDLIHPYFTCMKLLHVWRPLHAWHPSLSGVRKVHCALRSAVQC